MQKKKKVNPSVTLNQIGYLLEEKNKSLIKQFDERFNKIDSKFELIDQRFESIDRKFEQVDQRFDSVDQRFDLINQRFDSVDQRFDLINQRFDSVDKRFDEIYDAIQEATGNVYDLINEEFKPRIEKLENRAFAGV